MKPCRLPKEDRDLAAIFLVPDPEFARRGRRFEAVILRSTQRLGCLGGLAGRDKHLHILDGAFDVDLQKPEGTGAHDGVAGVPEGLRYLFGDRLCRRVIKVCIAGQCVDPGGDDVNSRSGCSTCRFDNASAG